MRLCRHKPRKVRTNDIFAPSMARKLKISWKEGAKDKPEVHMNGEIRNVTSLPLAIRNTNEFKFFTKLSEGLEN